MQENIDDAYAMGAIADQHLTQKKREFLSEHKKMERHFTLADTSTFLNGLTKKTINRYCAALGIDPKKYKDDDIDWCITMSEMYTLRTALREKLLKMPNDGRTEWSLPELHKTRFPNSKCKKIAIANQKGGVGKTTTAVMYAAGLSVRHEEPRVLIVDLDAQGTSSMYHVPDRDHPDFDCIPTLNDILTTPDDEKGTPEYTAKIKASVFSTTIPNLSIIPASPEDRGIDAKLADSKEDASIQNIYKVLSDVLAEIEDDYDVIIIDTPPSLVLSVYAALYCADMVIVPISPDENSRDASYVWIRYYSIVLALLTENGYQPPQWAMQILLTNFDVKSQTAQNIADEIIYDFGSRVIDPPMLKSEAVAVTASQLCSVFELSKSEYSKTKTSFTAAVSNASAIVSNLYRKLVIGWKDDEKTQTERGEVEHGE